MFVVWITFSFTTNLYVYYIFCTKNERLQPRNFRPKVLSIIRKRFIYSLKYNVTRNGMYRFHFSCSVSISSNFFKAKERYRPFFVIIPRCQRTFSFKGIITISGLFCFPPITFGSNVIPIFDETSSKIKSHWELS